MTLQQTSYNALPLPHLLGYVADLELEIDRLRRQNRLAF